jgi:flagellin
MALGVLNNISAIYAQNNLANTQASLSKTLQQLSSGSRINSGADDAAGLSLANGLQASSTALSQSAKNASQGVDFLQVADGALSQVTSLLNRAITLATEASNGTLNSSQVGAADAEYQKILGEINTINNNTEYNGINTFAKNAAYTVANAADMVDTTAGGFTVTFGSKTFTIQSSAGAGGATVTKLAAGGDTLANIAADLNAGLGSNVASVLGNQLILGQGATITTAANLSESLSQLGTATSTVSVGSANDVIKPGADGVTITYSDGTSAVLAGGFAAAGAGGTLANLASAISTAASGAGKTVGVTLSGNSLILTGASLLDATATETEVAGAGTNNNVAVFTSDGTISQSYNNQASDVVSTSTASLNLQGTSLAGTGVAQAPLTAINKSIMQVAAERGTIGANINTLTAVGNVMTTQSTNTLAAMNDVMATDYGQATSDMSKFQILSQTGIAALSQANQAQQLITKLLQ